MLVSGWAGDGLSGAHRVNRGGGYNNPAGNCRSAYHNANDPGNRNNNLGLRPAALLPGRKGTRTVSRPTGQPAGKSAQTALRAVETIGKMGKARKAGGARGGGGGLARR